MRPIAPGLFSDDVPPRLIGGRHVDSGRIVFPCPPGALFTPHLLGSRGTVWSFTIQRFRPKSPPYAGPEAFAPYPVAYVELPGEAIVEARLTEVDNDAVHVGMVVELTQHVLDPDAADPVVIPAFRPVSPRAVDAAV